MRPETFPTVLWKRERATFAAASVAPEDDVPEPAALVFPFYGDRIALADIGGRGWCIPSGHIEPGETTEEAVRREAYEEAGLTLGTVLYIGYFLLTDGDTGETRRAPTFIASVTGIGPIPDGSESRGMQLVGEEDISSLYFSWDALLASVFAYAVEEKQVRLRPGISLSGFFASPP